MTTCHNQICDDCNRSACDGYHFCANNNFTWFLNTLIKVKLLANIEIRTTMSRRFFFYWDLDGEKFI